MSLTSEQAQDLIFSLVNTFWLADPITLAHPLHWEDVKADTPGEQGTTTQPEIYGLASLQYLARPQSTIAKQRYLTEAVLTVQVFTAPGDGWSKSMQIEKVITDGLRAHIGSSSGFWMFDIAPLRVGRTGASL